MTGRSAERSALRGNRAVLGRHQFEFATVEVTLFTTLHRHPPATSVTVETDKVILCRCITFILRALFKTGLFVSKTGAVSSSRSSHT